jgi:hypothetical protein
VDLAIEYQQHEQIAPIISTKFREAGTRSARVVVVFLRMDVATDEWIVGHFHEKAGRVKR